MDKKYIKPEIIVEELAAETFMFTGSLEINDEGGNEESLSTGRRGKWGDLWAQGEE